MDVLWRDREPAAAANNLHQAVYVARRALDAGAIETGEEALQLIADVDVDRLELAAADARRARTPAAYRAALSLYGGELLPENRYDDWAVERRDELAELAAELAEELATLGSAEGDRLTPLPADASSFIGRGRELAELKSLLRGTRLLTLAGTGGAGKTRLALELARAAEPSYPDGVALVELAALADSGLVPDAVAARARRAGAVRAEPPRRGHRVPRAALAAAGRGQLRASARSSSWARGHAAALRACAHGDRDEPRAAARSGRGRVPGSVARYP